MRATMDYMVGNTAIQIRSSKNKITVIDVRKEKVRKSILKHLLAALVITGLLILLCFYVVRLENRKVMLDKSVYALQSQVDDMIKGNIVLQKELARQDMKCQRSDYELYIINTENVKIAVAV